MTAERGDDLTALAGRPWFAANEVLAFLLELAAVGCLCRWGFAAGDTTAAGLLLGLGAPAAVLNTALAERFRFPPESRAD
ncbi:MAG TPA: DUF2568 domain-containing protein [Streptomyces sp.]|jgi:hypothetical protein|nr:DUF2568 domain-containing protein [Streptomyces sp.]